MRDALRSSIIATMLALASPLAAQEPSTAQDEEARALFMAGQVAFEDGRFADALGHFTRSYELSRRPELLFNLANVHDRLRHSREAADAFRQYLAALPEAPNANFARNRLAALEAELAASPPAPDEAPSGPASSGGPSAPGIALLVTGGAFLIGGAAMIAWVVDRANLVDQCSALPDCLNGGDLTSERDAAIGLTVTLGAIGLIGIGVGAALLAGGSGGSASVSCVPTPGGLACAGRF